MYSARRAALTGSPQLEAPPHSGPASLLTTDRVRPLPPLPPIPSSRQFYALGDPLLAPGKSTLQFYSLANVNKWSQLGYLSIFTCFFYTLAWFIIKYLRHDKR